MTVSQANRISAALPLVLSGAAFALVMVNIAAGVAPQPDETTSAHLWQLLMAMQVPIIVLFAATVDWAKPRRALAILFVQALAMAIAALPVWLAGY